MPGPEDSSPTNKDSSAPTSQTPSRIVSLGPGVKDRLVELQGSRAQAGPLPHHHPLHQSSQKLSPGGASSHPSSQR